MPACPVFACQPASLAQARAALLAQLPGSLAPRQKDLIMLAAGEVWQNIIRHGAAGGSLESRFGFRLKHSRGRGKCRLWLTSWDSNPAADPASWRAPLPGSAGGFGLLLIRRIASQTRYRHSAGLNIAVLVFQPDRL